MSNLDQSIPGYRPRPATPEELKRLKEGGKRADYIKQLKESDHTKSDIPAAEDLLNTELENI